MKQLTSEEVHALKVAELGLDNEASDLTSAEAIAGALRRSGGFLCPCPPATLKRSIMLSAQGLVSDFDEHRKEVDETLEAMIAHGDFLEHDDFDDSADSRISGLLYAAPASFVSRQSGMTILLGIASDHRSALTEEFENRIEYFGHLRLLRPESGENLRADLLGLGLIEISYREWLNAPFKESPGQYLSRFDEYLDKAPPSGEVMGLELLDPERPVNYYPDRWVDPKSQTGRFVARRDQAYGAKLWSFVEMKNGQPTGLIDLPVTGGKWRGCDAAWHLQMAIDKERGEPQRYRMTEDSGGESVLVEFFSPIPMWARKRFDAIGEPTDGVGRLFAYRIPKSEISEEAINLQEGLWMAELD